jgi:hypothetical protein
MSKKKPKKERAKKYDAKLKVDGSFDDLLNELVPKAYPKLANPDTPKEEPKKDK